LNALRDPHHEAASLKARARAADVKNLVAAISTFVSVLSGTAI